MASKKYPKACRKTRAANASMKKRLKALRKKHGLGEFKRGSRAPRGSRTVKKRSSPRRAVFVARKRRKSYKRTLMSGLKSPIVAGVTYAFIQPFLSNALSRINIGIQDELLQIVAAILIKHVVKHPIATNWANAAIIINSASLASGFAGKILPSISAPALTGGLSTQGAPSAAMVV